MPEKIWLIMGKLPIDVVKYRCGDAGVVLWRSGRVGRMRQSGFFDEFRLDSCPASRYIR